MSYIPSQPQDPNMPFGTKNYRIMLLGIAVIMLGYLIMSLDGEPFGFGFLGITLGPLVLLAGFGIEFWAIFYQDRGAGKSDSPAE